MNIIETLNRRYATKTFDPSKKLSENQLLQLTESLRLTPSSYGLQPWKFIVISKASLRQELLGHSWGQSQITDASHLIVLCAKDDVTETDVQEYINDIASSRGAPLDALEGFKNMMNSSLESRTSEARKTWSEKQVYIALGFLLLSAAQLKIDACPIEGFDSQAYDKLLGLQGSGYHSTVVCPVGFRSQDDAMSQAPKVRYDADRVIEYIS